MTASIIRNSVANYCQRNKLNNLSIEAALIDMDGVLYDSMKYHTLAWQRMISELGISCTREEFYLYEGMTGAATIDLIFQRAYSRNATPEEIKLLYSRKAEYFIEMGQKETMPGAKEMLKTLSERGIKRVLVTGSAQNSLISRIEEDYPNIFAPDMRITANDVVNGKPHPEPYLKGLEKANVTANKAIVIENAPLGVEAGHAAGCFTIGITTDPIPAKMMSDAGADLVFESMPEFAKLLPTLLDAITG